MSVLEFLEVLLEPLGVLTGLVFLLVLILGELPLVLYREWAVAEAKVGFKRFLHHREDLSVDGVWCALQPVDCIDSHDARLGLAVVVVARRSWAHKLHLHARQQVAT